MSAGTLSHCSTIDLPRSSVSPTLGNHFAPPLTEEQARLEIDGALRRVGELMVALNLEEAQTVYRQHLVSSKIRLNAQARR